MNSSGGGNTRGSRGRGGPQSSSSSSSSSSAREGPASTNRATATTWVDDQRTLSAMKRRLQLQLLDADKQDATLLLHARLKRRRPAQSPVSSSSSASSLSSSPSLSHTPPACSARSPVASAASSSSPGRSRRRHAMSDTPSAPFVATAPDVPAGTADVPISVGRQRKRSESTPRPTVHPPLQWDGYTGGHPGQRSSASRDACYHHSRRTPEEDRSLEQLPQERSLVPVVHSVDRRNAHFYNWSINRRYLEVFQAYIWASAPLSPAALDEGNVRVVLYHSNESDMALAMNVHIVLALGARAMGELEHSMEHYMIARRHLEELFDSPNYAVAEALQGMRLYASGMGQTDQMVYYMLLSVNICRRLSIYHGDVYARTLTHYYFMPTTTVQEKRRIVSEFGINFTDKANLQSAAPDIRRQRLMDSPTLSSLLLKENRYPQFYEIERMTHLYALFLMQLDVLCHSGSLDDKAVLELAKGLETKCVEAVISVPCLFSKTALMGSLCHQAELASKCGDTRHAIRCALFWLRLSQQLPMRFCSPSILPFVHYILRVWEVAEEWDYLELSLEQIRPLAEIYPPWKKMSDGYLNLLQATLELACHKQEDNNLHEPSGASDVLLLHPGESLAAVKRPHKRPFHHQTSDVAVDHHASVFSLHSSRTSQDCLSTPSSSPTSTPPLRPVPPTENPSSSSAAAGLDYRTNPNPLTELRSARDMEEFVNRLLDGL